MYWKICSLSFHEILFGNFYCKINIFILLIHLQCLCPQNNMYYSLYIQFYDFLQIWSVRYSFCNFFSIVINSRYVFFYHSSIVIEVIETVLFFKKDFYTKIKHTSISIRLKSIINHTVQVKRVLTRQLTKKNNQQIFCLKTRCNDKKIST